MKIRKERYPVTEDGVVVPKQHNKPEGAFAGTKGILRMGKLYVTIVLPRDGDGFVEVVKAEFDNWKEMNTFLQEKEIIIK